MHTSHNMILVREGRRESREWALQLIGMANHCLTVLLEYINWFCSGLMKLSVEQKCDIATKEVDILREEMVRKDREYEQLLDSYKVALITLQRKGLGWDYWHVLLLQLTHMTNNSRRPPYFLHIKCEHGLCCWCVWLQATSAEAEIRLGEVKKEAYEFERDVSRGGVNPVRGMHYST